MACFRADDPNRPAAPAGWTVVAAQFSTKEECEEDCDGETGACIGPGGVCSQKRPCMCNTAQQQFLGLGTVCNPLP